MLRARVRRALSTEAAPAVNAPVIDIHPHVIAADSERHPRAPLGGHQSAWSQERPVGVEQLIVEQDRAGIQKAALVQASTCYGHDNSYVADAAAAYPDRFTGVFSCDILAPDACDTMAYWMDRGMRLEVVHDGQHDAGSGGLARRSALGFPRGASSTSCARSSSCSCYGRSPGASASTCCGWSATSGRSS
jgi:hypothetical protein